MEGGSFDERVKNMSCRPSSTRWIPTSEQIRILRDLYYNSGLRSPSAEQIQRISARLRQYGKIEGKNVFYWFQNHKARERQRKRYNEFISNTSSTSSAKNNSSCANSTNLSSIGGSGAPLMYGGGNNTSQGYCSGSVLMERSFRESFIVGGGGDDQHQVQSMEGNNNNANMCWNTSTTSSMVSMHQNNNYCCSDYNAYQESPSTNYRQMETLQLFPIHSNDHDQDEEQEHQLKENNESFYHMDCFFYGHHHQYPGKLNGSGGDASLELTLSSYCYPGST